MRIAVAGIGKMGAGMDAAEPQYRKAADSGHAGEDMAAVFRAFRH